MKKTLVRRLPRARVDVYMLGRASGPCCPTATWLSATQPPATPWPLGPEAGTTKQSCAADVSAQAQPARMRSRARGGGVARRTAPTQDWHSNFGFRQTLCRPRIRGCERGVTREGRGKERRRGREEVGGTGGRRRGKGRAEGSQQRS